MLSLLEVEKTATIQHLAEELGVSQETIRRDVKVMEETGHLQRYHGGVRLPDNIFEAPFRQRQHKQADAKERIGARTAQFIQNNQSVMIEGTTTALWVARHLTYQRNLSVITNGLDIARELTGRNNNSVYFAGGQLSEDTLSTLEKTTISYLAQFTPDIVIIGASAIHPETGITEYTHPEALVAKAMIKQASKCIVVADDTKFNQRALVKVCDINQIDILVTSAEPDDELKKSLSRVDVIVV